LIFVSDKKGKINYSYLLKTSLWKLLEGNGHVLRKDHHNITREIIFWTADGKRKRGRPKTSF
jgi:hypothetical protein